MEVKKSEKANLEHLKSIFFLIGLIVTLSLNWYAFEYKTYDKVENLLADQATLEDEEDIVIQTQRNELPPPPPPPQQQTSVIEIVDDNVKLDLDLKFDAEMDEDADIQDAAPIKEKDEEEEKEEEIFVFVEDQAGYIGGEEERMKYLRDNIKYPEMAKESGIQGTVHLKFVVEKDGAISNVQVIRGIGGGCDEEAVKVVKSMPRWQPAKQRGRPVRVWFNMPIKFTLQG